MPSFLCLGDSLTAGDLGAGTPFYSYRGYLKDGLEDAGVTCTLVGPLTNDDGVSASNTAHAGYGGATIGSAATSSENSGNNLWARLAAITGITPDYVILCIGANDINGNGSGASGVGTRADALLDAIAAKWPAAVVIACPPPQATYWDAGEITAWTELKNAMQAWATQSGLKWFVDLHGAGLVGDDFVDGLHWSSAGAIKVSSVLTNAYTAISAGGTPGSDDTEVQIFGIDVAGLLATALQQPVGSQRAKFLADMAAQLGSTPAMAILVDGVTKYRAQSTAALPSSADGLGLPAATGTPSTNVADPLTAQNKKLILSTPDDAKRIVVPLTIGAASILNTAKISAGLDGSKLVSSGGFLFKAPTILDAGSTGGGGGGGGSTGGALTIQQFYDDMMANNYGRMWGWNAFHNSGNHSNHQSSGVKPGVVAAGAQTRGTTMPTFWKNNGNLNPAFKDAEIWPFWAGWFIAQAQADYSDNILGSNLGLRVKIGRQVAFAITKSNQVIFFRNTRAGHFWFKAQASDQKWVNDSTQTVTNSDGGQDAIFDNNFRSLHLVAAAGGNAAYPVVNNRVNLSSLTGTGTGTHNLKFIGFALEAWLEQYGNSPAVSASRILGYVGHDPYPQAYSDVSEDDRPGISYTANKLLTDQPQWFATGTITDARIDFTGPVSDAGISFAALQAFGITF